MLIDNVELGAGRKTQGMSNVGSRKRTKYYGGDVDERETRKMGLSGNEW